MASRFPVHVTVKLLRFLPRLRRRPEHATLCAAFAAGRNRGNFRLVHYAVLNNHLHFLVEAADRRALNKLWRRRGRVFADRFHDRILKSPREVRNVLRYVLANGRKHAAEGREVAVPGAIDTFTSAPWFDGLREAIVVRGLPSTPRPVADARTWMLTIGWRRHGLLSVRDLPTTA